MQKSGWFGLRKMVGMVGAMALLFAVSTSRADINDYLVIDLSEGGSASNYPVSYLDAVPSGGWTDDYKTTKLVLRRIPSGTFTMGSPTNELGRVNENETQREVTLTKDYYMGVFEVTQRQWELVMGNRPSYFNNATYYASRPVEQVSYYEIRENADSNTAITPNWPQSSEVGASSFVGKLRSKTGLTTLDLPTDAQWEYACRAGTTTALNSGKNLTDTESDPNMSEVGRYLSNGGSGFSQGGDTSVGTARVGSYLPNAWGLYDMHGNVYESCLDWYESYHAATTNPVGAASGLSRVIRGGGWISFTRNCRSAFRNFSRPGYRSNIIGFRLTANYVTGRRPRLSWPAVPGATWYQLWISRNSGTYDTPWVEGTTNWMPSAASGLPGGDYRWWVRAWGPEIGMGTWSSPAAEFSIVTRAPSAITQVAPTGTQATNDLDYRWDKDADATWYRLWVGRDGAGTWHDRWFNLPGTGEASVNPGGAYPGPAKPVLTAPAGQIADSTLTYEWAGGGCAWWLRPWGPDGYGPWSGAMEFSIPYAAGTWFRVYVSRDGAAVHDGWTNEADGSLALPEVLQSGAHSWWLGVWDSAAKRTIWSDRMDFNVQ